MRIYNENCYALRIKKKLQRDWSVLKTKTRDKVIVIMTSVSGSVAYSLGPETPDCRQKSLEQHCKHQAGHHVAPRSGV